MNKQTVDTSKPSFDDNLATFCNQLCNPSEYPIVRIPFAWLPYVCSHMTKLGYALKVVSYFDNSFGVKATYEYNPTM